MAGWGMPWKNSSVVTERKNFIEAVLAREGSFRALCARFGISRRVGYKWLERYRKAGEKGLRDASRRPPPRRPKRLLNNGSFDSGQGW